MKKRQVISVMEIVIAALLFVSMLFFCGKYIDIKINGKSSSLPEIPEKDMRILTQTYSNENVEEKHTLAEPVSVGVKVGNVRLMAHTKEARRSLMDFARVQVIRCFSGESETLEFESDEKMTQYLSQVCDDNDYMFFTFYGDIPAAAFLPALAKEYESKDSRMYFNVQNLFLLADKEQNLYAITVSSGKHVNILKPLESTPFKPSDYDAYNDITGFAPFEYDGENCLLPVYSNSLEHSNYTVENACSVYGMDTEEAWIQNTIGVLGLNKNFYKTFVTKDNSLIDFVDDTNELMFSFDGSVTYNSNADGLSLYDILGYRPTDSSYTFPDKTLAVKRLFNMLDGNICGDEANLGITNVYYNESSSELCFEMKYFVSGIAVSDKTFDARVEMDDESITHVYFDALACKSLEETSPSLPQKYAFFENGDADAVCHYRILSPIENENNKYSVTFATLAHKQKGDG